MSNLCIIPARGGSKRIPRKNIKDFLGKPIITYSIEVALQSKLFDEVMVSTDDEEIATIAKDYGAKVPFFRSKVNSNDFATTVDVLKEVLNEYKNKEQKIFEFGCCIYPTAPLISIKKISEGFFKMKNGKYDSIFPIVPFSFPIQRALKIENGKTLFSQPEHINTRSQDLDKRYHDAGQWYWFDCNKFVKSNQIITNNTSSIILDELTVQDIDNETDWKLAELKYELLQNFK